MSTKNEIRPVSNGGSIQEKWGNFKGRERVDDLLVFAIVVLVAFAAFLLGRMSAQSTDSLGHLLIEETVMQAPSEEDSQKGVSSENFVAPIQDPEPSLGGYVASRQGTKYHLPWCPGARTIKEENKLWFATKEEAEAEGYTPAANCKGI